MSNIPQYSFLYLVIRHQCPFATINHLHTSKTSLVKSFLSTLADLPGGCSCCLEQLFRRKPVSAFFVERNSLGHVFSGVLKARKTESCSLQGHNFTKKRPH